MNEDFFKKECGNLTAAKNLRNFQNLRKVHEVFTNIVYNRRQKSGQSRSGAPGEEDDYEISQLARPVHVWALRD